MLDRLRERMTFANTISMIALFVALGGTGYAAVKLPRNSVGAAQIKTGGVGSSEAKNGSLRAVDFRAGELPAGARGDKGDKGEKGDPGTNGTNGTNGADGTADAFARVTASGTLLDEDPPGNPDFGSTTFNISQANVDRPGAAPPGVYCIRGLPFKLSSAMVAPDNAGASAAADNDVIVSVAVERGNNINPCDDVAGRPKAQARVVATEADGTPANLDHGFVIWLEGEQ